MKAFAYNLGGFLHLLTWKDYLIMFLIFLIMVLILKIYDLIKINEEKEKKDNLDLGLDLKEITTQIEKEEPRTIKLTDYEIEQESKAIISYQELLNQNKNIKFFDDEEDYQNFEVKIKKINLDESNRSSPKQEKKEVVKDQPKVQMMSYESENEFLDALKKLQIKLSK